MSRRTARTMAKAARSRGARFTAADKYVLTLGIARPSLANSHRLGSIATARGKDGDARFVPMAAARLPAMLA